MAHFGAEIVRTPGHYDDAVTQAADDAQRLGRIVISDTSYEGYMEIPKDVMQGYQLMVDEAIAAAPDPISQTFIQAGVGGVAAAVCSYFWERLGSQRPQVVVVEPSLADCCFQSAVAGQPTRAKGDLNTLMAGLACGYPSLLAWEILGPGADAFMTVDDGAAVDCMKLLAHGLRGDPPLVAGESAVAGLAGLIAAVQGGYGADLGLDRHSQVLLFGCEGATDPELYHKLVA
ncbi:MAG: diaminopropionate ammonia-lyase [Candidatus Competibacterales bacterium]